MVCFGKGRDAEKLPNLIKVDCITVSMAPIKAAIDDQISRLHDALVTSLRKAVTNIVTEIESFLDRGMDALSERPSTVAEIGKTNAKHAELSKEKPAIKPMFDSAESKNTLLRKVVGVPVDLEHLRQRWDKFELLLSSHELMIQDQIKVITYVADFAKRTQCTMRIT